MFLCWGQVRVRQSAANIHCDKTKSCNTLTEKFMPATGGGDKWVKISVKSNQSHNTEVKSSGPSGQLGN